MKTKTKADYNLLSVSEVVKLTGVARSTVIDNIKKRRLPATLSADGDHVVRRADALAWQKNRTKPKRYADRRGELG